MSTNRPTRNIVVLDGYTLNPGDLTWDRLERLGKCTFHDRTPADQIIDRARDASIVLTNKVVLSRAVLDHLPQLEYIGVLATGTNVVDFDAASAHKIIVTNVPAYSTSSVAQLVFAHLLHFTHHVSEHSASVRRGDWAASDDFCYWNHPLVELDGLTMGIVGLGQIGRAVARLADAHGMRVFAVSTSSQEPPDYVELVPMERLLHESDVVSLHCPLTPATTQLINRARLALMKPTALLINTSRGPVVDEEALAEALNSGQIAGAGLDVLAVEPPPADHPLVAASNCHITPHIAWASRSARQRLLATAVRNIEAFLEGKPENVVPVG
jgi:glycerate dehydrogenase